MKCEGFSIEEMFPIIHFQLFCTKKRQNKLFSFHIKIAFRLLTVVNILPNRPWKRIMEHKDWENWGHLLTFYNKHLSVPFVWLPRWITGGPGLILVVLTANVPKVLRAIKMNIVRSTYVMGKSKSSIEKVSTIHTVVGKLGSMILNCWIPFYFKWYGFFLGKTIYSRVDKSYQTYRILYNLSTISEHLWLICMDQNQFGTATLNW